MKITFLLVLLPLIFFLHDLECGWMALDYLSRLKLGSRTSSVAQTSPVSVFEETQCF